MNNLAAMATEFNKFKREFEQKNPGVSPQDFINCMMRDGKITQQQFERARQIANQAGYKV